VHAPAIAVSARTGASRASRVIGALIAFVVTAVLAAALLVVALLARLGRGPLELPWAIPPIEARAAAAAHPLKIGRLALAWDGLRDGFFAAPLRLTADDVRLIGGDATIRHMAASASVADLFTGDPVPQTLDLDGVFIRSSRAADGRVSVAGTPIPSSSGQQPGGDIPTSLNMLRSLHVHDLTVEAADAGTNISARLTGDVGLDRDPTGLLHGRAHADLAAGTHKATVDLTAAAAGDGSQTTLTVATSPFDPADYADLLPSLAPLMAFDAPITLTASGTLGRGLSPQRAHLDAQAGPGLLRVGVGTAPILSLTLGLDATPDSVTTTALTLVTAPRPDGPRTTFTGHVHARKTGSGYAIATVLDLDRAAFADLPAIWPEGTGGPGTRPWITGNITAGYADHVHVEADLTTPADLSDVALTRIDGGLDGHDLTVWWLRPVPPLVGGEVRMSVHQVDEIDLAVSRARQQGTSVVLDGSTIRLTGIAGNDQFAAIDAPIRGRLPDIVRTLSNPALNLLSKSNVPLGDTSGSLAGRILIAHLPLRDDVSMDNLGIVTDAAMRDVRIGKLIAGRDLDHGQLKLHATSDGLTIMGTASLAHIPATAKIEMDFRDGPPSQVTVKGHVATTLDPDRLRRVGVDVGTVLTGGFGLIADAQSRRDGSTTIAASADLTNAGFAAGPLPWRKAIGAPVTASAVIGLDKAGLRSVQSVRAQGSGVDVDASAEILDGKPSVLRVRTLRLGTAVDLAGTVSLPTAAGTGYVVDVSGPTLDLSGVRKALSGTLDGGADERPTPIAATVDIARVTLGDGRALLDVAGHFERDDTGVRVLELAGRTAAPPAPFRVVMRPTPLGRLISATTDDLGGVLAGFGVTTAIGGGRLDISGVPGLDRLGQPSTIGTATLTAFRVRDAPFVARLLKALTLYGIVDLLRGPGVGVTRLTVPYRLAGDVLTTDAARAVSLSLGVTAKGQLDLGRGLLRVRGTVVPAWILNTLPGRLPLIGTLFSPEKGGGVVAAMFDLSGKLSDPAIAVNPLSLLTPGALRGVFGGFATPKLPDLPGRP